MNKSNVKYYINEEKRTVVAVIESNIFEVSFLFENAMREFMNVVKNAPIFDPVIDKNYYIKNRYVGIAKCSPNDIFDVEFGKQLALQRAKIKKTSDIEKKFFKIVDALDKLKYIVEKQYYQLYRNWINESERKYKLLQAVYGDKKEID